MRLWFPDRLRMGPEFTELRSSLISELRRAHAHKFTKHSGKLARILKTDIESHVENTASSVGEHVFCTFYSLQ